MRTAGIVFRRELGAFFDSPIAYVVAIGFLLLNSALWVLDLWSVNEASLRGFFEWVSWSSCFIIPAITMRTWADERRGATFELLLTLPSSTAWIVLGKFLAALAFYAFCLLGSLVLPACLQALSVEGLGPDWGAIVAGYLGSLATGALLIALGMFLSGLCRDQIEAFIVTLVVVVALRLLGFAPIAGQVDAVFAGAGSFLLEFVSFSTPLMRFVRGVVGLGDVLFFVAWIAGFLLLNAVFVEESRLKPGTRSRKLGAALLGIPAIVLVGSLALELTPRADLTAEKLYTVSDAASEILGQIPESEPVNVKLYFSPKSEMPAFMATLERDVTERLEALKRRSNGRLAVDVVHLHADDAILKAQEMLRAQLGEEEDAESKGTAGEVEETLLKEGVVPFRVRSGGLTGTETKVVYAAVSLTQGARPKEVIPQLMPGQIGALEQELLTRIWRMVKDEKPIVGLLAPITSLSIDPAQLQLLAQLGMPVENVPREQDDYRMIPAIVGQGERIDVRRLRPDDAKPLPEGMRTLVIVQPGELSERMRWEISRFLHRGGSVIVAAQAFEYGLRPVRGGAAIELRKGEPGVAELLSQFGLSVPPKMVLSEKSFPLSYDLGPFQAPVTVDFRWSFELDAANFDRETSLANGLGGMVVIQAASPVEKDDAKLAELGLAFQPVLSTGEKSWTRDVPEGSIPEDINDVQSFTGPLPLAALVSGIFPAPSAPPPPWPEGEGAEPDPPAADEAAAAAPGRLMVIGMANPFRDDAVAAEGGLTWSGVFAKNAVEALSLGDVLMKLTVRDAKPRPLKDIDRGTLLFFESVMIGLAPLIVAVIGILRLLARKRRQQQAYVRTTGPAMAAPGVGEGA